MERFADVPKTAAENYRTYPSMAHPTSPQTVHHLATKN
jgi:hypothetical protein